MNCPAKGDPPVVGDRRNQSPDELCTELTTRSDLGRIANARRQRGHRLSDPDGAVDIELENLQDATDSDGPKDSVHRDGMFSSPQENKQALATVSQESMIPPSKSWLVAFSKPLRILRKYCKFVGPGFMISVAYIDPGNYATDIVAGASYRFKLLFVILLSNIIAVFLQSLCIHLGTVTGMNLSQMTREHCPRWLNLISYAFGELAIIATDVAEVIGTAIALNLLSNGKIPLVAGCAISIVDVMFILIFFSTDRGTLSARRVFEAFVAMLVLGVVICFCIQLSYIQHTSVGQVFRGYVPSSTLIKGQALYQACGILGATVMPHSLYLGSGLVQERLKDFDKTNNLLPSAPVQSDDESIKEKLYKPSLRAIRSCKSYSIAECAISLFTFALFVNSAILIVAGASLSNVKGASDASLFSIYDLLSQSLAKAVGKLFAVALLLSGISAGIICTIAGQMISEGQINWRMAPWKRRLLTRSLSITPSIIVAGSLGEEGVNKALVGSQVALSVILPFVSAPLIWFVCRAKYMTIRVDDSGVQQGVLADDSEEGAGNEHSRKINMRVHPVVAVFAVLIWGLIVVMNVALIVLLGLGKT